MNGWCEVLKIAVPSVERLHGHPEANTFSLLIVALLERGEPMTLEEVAARFEEAGVAAEAEALRSLKRCRPARNPVYRDGDRYGLDPHSDELDFWAFRLGLRPAKWALLDAGQATPTAAPAPPRVPELDEPLTRFEIEEAFRSAWVYSWSALRLAMAVLDAHGGRLSAEDVVSFLDGLGARHVLGADAAAGWNRGGVRAAADGVWELEPHHPSVRSMRKAVRDRVEVARRHKALREDPAVAEERRKRIEEAKRAHRAELAGLRRAVLHAAPAAGPGGRPVAVTLVDVDTREVRTWVGADVAQVEAALAGYDVVAGLDIRGTLRVLGIEHGTRRLADLAPPQKSMVVPGSGRTLKITTETLIRGSCGISRPLTHTATLRRYAVRGPEAKLRSRMESDAMALFALYQYGRLHGAVRVRWRSVDERLSVPWSYRDEPTFYDLVKDAEERGVTLEVVTGPVADWEDPWATAFRCRVVPSARWRPPQLVDGRGWPVNRSDVQLARVSEHPAAASGPGGVGRLELLSGTPPWDWPADAAVWILDVLRDASALTSERRQAVDLAGEMVVVDDAIAQELLRILADPAEPVAVRAGAAIAFGPVLEEHETWDESDPEPPAVSEFLVRRAVETLEAVYRDAGAPKEVRRRALEAAVRAPAEWQRGAAADAFRSRDREWRLTAVFAMGHLGGFGQELAEALDSRDRELLMEAIRAAGRCWEDRAWPRARDVILNAAAQAPWIEPMDEIERDLLLAAIETAAALRPDDAALILDNLADCGDPEIAEAASDAILEAAEDDFLGDPDSPEGQDGPGGFLPHPFDPNGGKGTTFH